MEVIKKKVGNACRTKNQIRASKSRGAQMEYIVRESLQQHYGKDAQVLLTKELGFVAQYDILVEFGSELGYKTIGIECKFHKSITWNQAKKWFLKLEKKVDTTDHQLFFKSNQQPILMMERLCRKIIVSEVEQSYKVKFKRYNVQPKRKKRLK